MAESNGSGRIDDHEDRIGKLKAARRETDDALVVMSDLESRAPARLKEHAEFVAYLEASIRSHDKRMEEQEGNSKELDKRIDKLVSSIGELIARIQPSSLTQ